MLEPIIELTPARLEIFAKAAGHEPVEARASHAHDQFSLFDDMTAADIEAERGRPGTFARLYHADLLKRDRDLDNGAVAHTKAAPEHGAKPKGHGQHYEDQPQMTEADYQRFLARAGREGNDAEDAHKARRQTAVDKGMAPGGYSIEHHATVDHDLPVELARAWLCNVFYAARGLGIDLPAGPMKAAAARQGFSEDTLDRARRLENVEWVRVGRSYVWRWTNDALILAPQKLPIGERGTNSPGQKGVPMTQAPTAPPPFDWELTRTVFLADASGLDFAQVLLCEHYDGSKVTDYSLVMSLPDDWHERLEAAWDEWETLLKERLEYAQLRQTIAALEAVKASGRTWTEQAVADEAGLSVEDLRATVERRAPCPWCNIVGHAGSCRTVWWQLALRQAAQGLPLIVPDNARCPWCRRSVVNHRADCQVARLVSVAP